MSLDDRIPCPDDMCTGTINERGVCNYCGARGTSIPRSAGAPASAETPLVPAPAEASPSAAAEASVPEASVPAAHDPEERIPCLDDMCTGTLNAHRVCNYCKRQA